MVEFLLNSRGQMKIQQMAFMMVAVFLFFMLVGLFFLNITLRDVNKSSSQLQKEQVISSMKVITNMPELNCDSRKSICLDKDKLSVMSGEFGKSYNENFWPVASVEVFIISNSTEARECPGFDCNYYPVFKNSQENKNTFSTFVSVCEKTKKLGYVYDNCEIGKLVVGMRIYEN